MAKCDYCGTNILLGGVKEQSYRFCNENCKYNGRALIAANQVPVEVLDEQVKDALFSLFLGWWGFPWGLIVTPIQILRNLVGMLIQPDSSQPSRKLRRLVLIHIGTNMMQSDL